MNSNNKVRAVLALVASIGAVSLSAGFAQPVSADQTSAQGAVESQVLSIISTNSGLSKVELVDEAALYAAQAGVSQERALKQAAAESQASLSAAAEGQSSGMKIKRTKKIGKSRHWGDIVVMPTTTAGLIHGHTAIFNRPNSLVEAPGSGKKSRSVSTKNYKVSKKTSLMDVRVSQKKRTSSGIHAYSKFRGKSYNKNFAFNRKTSGSKMNCSQLVWAAYKVKAKVDLDGNGGFGVYLALRI